MKKTSQGFSLQDENELDDETGKMEFDERFDPSFSPSKPLKRHFRRMKKEKFPYFSPEGICCCSYTATIINMFKLYTQQLVQTQKLGNNQLTWGKAVQPGRHQSKTIDAKKRGCLSVYMYSSEEETEIEFKSTTKSPVTFDPVVEQTSPTNPSLHIRFTSSEEFKIDDYDAEMEDYDNNEVIDDDKDVDFVPNKEISVKAKRKQRLTTKRKKSISPVNFTKDTNYSGFIGDSDIDLIPDSQSNSKDSKSSSQSKSNSKDEWLPGSQGSFLNAQGDLISTQIQQRRSRKKHDSGKQPKKNPQTRTETKRKLSESSDEDMLTNHLNDLNKKKRKFLSTDFSMLKSGEIFGEGDTDLKLKVSKTYLKKDKLKSSHVYSPSIDIEKILANPVLKYVPPSSQSSQRLTAVSPRSQNQNSFISEERSLSPIKPVIKKSFSYNMDTNESNDEGDKYLLKQQKTDVDNYNKACGSKGAKSRQGGHVLATESFKKVTDDFPALSGGNVEEVVMVTPNRCNKAGAQRVNMVSPQRRSTDGGQVSCEATPSNSLEVQEHEEMVDCPLCGENFAISVIERHAANCGLEEEIPQVKCPKIRPEDNEGDLSIRQTRSASSRN